MHAATDVCWGSRGAVPLRVDAVIGVEDNVWSPMFGLKGKLDASLRVVLGGQGELPSSSTDGLSVHPKGGSYSNEHSSSRGGGGGQLTRTQSASHFSHARPPPQRHHSAPTPVSHCFWIFAS